MQCSIRELHDRGGVCDDNVGEYRPLVQTIHTDGSVNGAFTATVFDEVRRTTHKMR